MSILQPVVIVLIAAAFAGGALLGWLLRGERHERGDDVRRARLQAQLDASQETIAALQRKRDELQKRSDDAVHRHHGHKRQVKAYRSGLDELASRNRRLEQKLSRSRDQLKESLSERDKLARQLKLMIKRTHASRQAEQTTTAPAAGKAPLDLNDLQRVRGIGPAIAKKLRALGIDNLGQIAELDDEGIDSLDQELKFPGRIRRDDWVGQARELIGGKREPAH